jgi:hypothetical protein
MSRLFTLVCLFLVACQEQSLPTSNAEQTQLREQTSQLQSRLTALQSTVSGLSSQVAILTNRLNMQSEEWTTAEFDPTEPSYQRVDAKPGIGSFAVSVQDVQTFGDGVRIRLNLGNPSSAIVSGVELRLKYGPRAPAMSDPNFGQEYSTWLEGLQSKNQELMTDLRPGSWNPISVTLPRIDAKNFGYLEVGMSNKVISLSSR